MQQGHAGREEVEAHPVDLGHGAVSPCSPPILGIGDPPGGSHPSDPEPPPSRPFPCHRPQQHGNGRTDRIGPVAARSVRVLTANNGNGGAGLAQRPLLAQRSAIEPGGAARLALVGGGQGRPGSGQVRLRQCSLTQPSKPPARKIQVRLLIRRWIRRSQHQAQTGDCPELLG